MASAPIQRDEFTPPEAAFDRQNSGPNSFPIRRARRRMKKSEVAVQ